MIFSFVNPPCKAAPPGARVIRPPEKSFFSKKVIIMCLDDHIKRKASSERILFKRAALISTELLKTRFSEIENTALRYLA